MEVEASSRLWSRVLQGKYGDVDMVQGESVASNGSIWWKDIMLACGGEVDWFESCVSKVVGKGDAMKFWEDRWKRNDITFKQKYKRLFDISLQQSSLINQVGGWEEGKWKWSLSWRRSLFVWENALLENLMRDLEVVTLKEGHKDKWIWEASDDGLFSVKSCYEVLRGPNSSDDHVFFKQLWSVVAPSKVFAFTWRVALDMIQTKQNLKKKGVI